MWSHASNVHAQLPNGTRSRVLPCSLICTFILCVYLARLHCRRLADAIGPKSRVLAHFENDDCFVCFDALRPSQQYPVMSGRFPIFLG